MTAITDFFSGLGFWTWILIGLVLTALETFIPGVHFLWFGLAAVAVGGLVSASGAFGYGDVFTWPWQLVTFAVISVLTVFWVRGFSRGKDAESDVPALNVRAEQYVGRVVTVEDAIAGGRGKVRVGDTLWPAQGPDLARGARVRVTGTSGTVLIVEPA
jgi:membrane protein implicated in regulation of membrane protease activity